MKRVLSFGFLLMGFSFTVTQGLLIRELLVAFFGNELSIGVNVGRVGNPSRVRVGEGTTVSVGLTGVISTRRCGPVQDTSPAPSAARTPFWRNFLLLSFPFIAMTAYDPELASMKGCV